MNRKWFGIAALIVAAISLLTVASCGDPQELTSITVQPTTETFGASNIPVAADAGLSVQLRALGNYVHPPVTKDITSQVVWASNDTQMFTVTSGGLLTATGEVCGGTLASATVTTNKDGSGLSASGAVVTGYMTANVVCFTSTSSGGGSGPAVTVNFAGAGVGTVSSSPAGINCASTNGACTGIFATGTTVVLTGTPIGTGGMSWSGNCTSISGNTCTIDSLSTDVAVTATFN
jgi:hypothetical protein